MLIVTEERNPQLDIIETLDRPIIVQAGAGSGKTRTLTERIVAALTPEENGNVAARSVENIVAITFTKKAAEELKSRLRARLEEAGMHAQALLVDDANITTIHGFASRILRENALDFGIDANFEIISEAENKQIFNDALNISMTRMYSGADVLDDFLMDAIEQLEDSFSKVASGDVADVFDEDDDDDDEYEELDLDIAMDEDLFDIKEELREHFEDMISDFVQQQSGELFGDFIARELWDDGSVSAKAIYDAVWELVDSFSTQPLLDEPHVFVGTYFEIGDVLRRIADLLKRVGPKINFDLTKQSELDYPARISESIEAIETFLKEKHDGTPVSVLMPRWLDLLDGIPKLTPKLHKNEDDFAYVLKYRQNLAKLILEFLVTLNRDCMMNFYRLATLTFEEMQDEKDNFKFSNNDLLRVCFQRLSRLPEVAKSYQDKFDLIMIDEFQDTDSLQLEIIRLVSRGNFENVCTVGDVQQSIYRFRGADVNVFKNYKEKMLRERTNVLIKPLSNNYRSHADILALTDKVFENPNMFGESFLSLVPKGVINNSPDPIFNDIPRVQIEVMNHKTRGKGEKFSAYEAVVREAKKAATHLKSLKDAGAKPSSMAILLAKLASNTESEVPVEIAKIYQDALLEVGIESVISGGSTFSRSSEAQVVLCLLAIARNALDSDALACLLKSDVFNVSDDALLALTSVFSNSGSFEHKQNLSYGFLSMDEAIFSTLNDDDIKIVAFAHEQITSFMQNVRCEGVVVAIREFLSACGVFDELQKQASEGLVRAGNYEKALAIIKEIQQKTAEIAEVHTEFSEFLANSKEAPGILSSVNSNYVQIMTVHSAKGLEFDHVVVAELTNGKVSRQSTYISNTPVEGIGQYTYYSAVKPIDRENLRKFVFREGLILEDVAPSKRDMSAGELYAKMWATELEEELGETKRLLYVALTRAVKSVLLQVRIGSAPKDDYADCGIWAGVYDAFKWDYNCTKSTQFFELKNGSKGKLSFEYLPEGLDFEENDVPNEESKEEPEVKTFNVRKPANKLPVIYGSDENSEFLSYSNLEKVEKHEMLDVQVDSVVETDADKATEFGSQVHSCLERAVALNDFKLDEVDEERLRSAVKCVFATQEFKKVLQYDTVTPEMEFCVPIEIAGETKFLRGEMDLVGMQGNEACVIDYKTGTTPIDHTLQAKVYAYALLSTGVQNVKIHFVHAEIPDLVQSFEFVATDVKNLKQAIEEVSAKL